MKNIIIQYMDIKNKWSIILALLLLIQTGCSDSNITSTIDYTESITDASGNVYKTVRVGNQIWMAENLRTENYNNRVSIQSAGVEGLNLLTTPIYYIKNDDKLVKNGHLYNWIAAKDSRGICPPGYRIPSVDDFSALFSFVGNNSSQQLRSKTGWSDGKNGLDRFGFNAQPSGIFHSPGFDLVGKVTAFWTSNTVNNTAFVSVVYFSPDSPVPVFDTLPFVAGLSVRCLRNN